ncbi:DUF397 domain-containing protein [Micromonospora craterilacus]|uniref:DUF397 domain-containing protein n=1 Tax=Micromonospora craterilacus TaxID=1655439 RepID=A0A2W2D7N6_9ACTN|nr:DUF397 domain-containing protein [Micromonospora craterilacus]PZG08046.1 DUF397 domain-containing protein [Micromonospora craterilacus]
MKSQPTWRKSSRSDDGNCVEVAHTHEPVLVRDSKNTAGPVLRFAPEQWHTFMDGIRLGGFESPTAME